ncbi:hypothetical protein TTHERM_00268300 (macronuclear) [Tetrahymena thermophila SB210]|uniref:Uncharacterized protein n=1 Tax=Tetrahymena thermophila (strain SB210) TaxID=312017 RepID=I7M7R8_TETTS|nr:hypothetical protein TTHERM_00268300 [Tetrahymena thermophila SB210]EAR95719.2 hypothetical protein TTHERM_00268300 [Tetrahymena thermophila SB210]|eukprot:XP_001015964.2 hypothetical protein TTHERM_00268300 [Tetrahymena thermophila SB210]
MKKFAFKIAILPLGSQINFLDQLVQLQAGYFRQISHLVNNNKNMRYKLFQQLFNFEINQQLEEKQKKLQGQKGINYRRGHQLNLYFHASLHFYYLIKTRNTKDIKEIIKGKILTRYRINPILFHIFSDQVKFKKDKQFFKYRKPFIQISEIQIRQEKVQKSI